MPSLDIVNYPKPLEPVMIFIDGGYLRKLFADLFGDDNINFALLRDDLLFLYEKTYANPFRGNLIRAYYYDGITDEKEKEYREQREYFDTMKKHCMSLDIVLGEAVKLENGKFRQKGVDILMAVDVLTMAYQDHFNSGIFFLGDRDFIPLIEAVKGAGKKTYFFYYTEKVPMELIQAFDFSFPLDKANLKHCHIEKMDMGKKIG